MVSICWWGVNGARYVAMVTVRQSAPTLLAMAVDESSSSNLQWSSTLDNDCASGVRGRIYKSSLMIRNQTYNMYIKKYPSPLDPPPPPKYCVCVGGGGGGRGGPQLYGGSCPKNRKLLQLMKHIFQDSGG